MTENKSNFLIFASLAIFTLYTERFSFYPGVILELGVYKYLVFMLFFLISIYFFVNKNKTFIKYSKCPKCGETYNYSELKDGMCPQCDVKTIDLEKYYDKK